MRAAENNPKRKICEEPGRVRLKSNKGLKTQARKEMEKMTEEKEREEFAVERRKPWCNIRNERISLWAELTEKCGKSESEEVRRAKAERTMEKRREEYGREVFTDGSAEEGMKNGGSGVVWKENDRWKRRMRPGGALTSSYRTEVGAMREAMAMLEEGEDGSVVVYTDSKSLVMALQNGTATMDKELEGLKEEMWRVSRRMRLGIQWIPAHVGIEGNEEADKVANEARQMDREGVKVDMSSVKSMIKRVVRRGKCEDERLRRVYRRKIEKEDLSRREAVLMAQLRGGHCPTTRYYQHSIGLVDDAVCEDCGEVEDKVHIFECPRWESLRSSMEVEGRAVLGKEEVAVRYLRVARPSWFE
jgi:ribonuclease HI